MSTIFIVEDDPKTAAIYTEALQAKGHQVLHVTTVKDATAQLMNLIPDVLLLDIMLPGGQNGFDLLEQIRKDVRLQNLKVIVLTNLDSEEKTAREIGVSGYLVKPHTSIEQLVQIVEQTIGGTPQPTPTH